MANNNLGFTMTIKATDGTLVPLYPQTIKSQIVGWNAGEVYGPYQLTLSANNWSNNQQTVNLNGISPDNVLKCNKVLSGTQEEMISQDQAYSLLSPTGIESLQNQVRFTAVSQPTVDLTVSVYWTI